MTTEDRAWSDYSEQTRRDLIPKLLGSALFLSIGTEPKDFDVKQATEIGAALLMDKPFVLLVPKGRTVSERLRRAADVILDEFDFADTGSQTRLTDVLSRVGLG